MSNFDTFLRGANMLSESEIIDVADRRGVPLTWGPDGQRVDESAPEGKDWARACNQRLAQLRSSVLGALVLGAVLATLLPTPAYACSGWLDCTFGWTERTEVRNSAAIERERIEAQSAAQIAEIEAQGRERVELAKAEVERVKQMQFESEAHREIEIARAEAKAREYEAMIASLTQRTTADIRASADTQIAALDNAARIAVAGITQTGETERLRIAWGWIFAVVALFILGVVVIKVLRYYQPPTVVFLPRQPRGYISDSERAIVQQRRREIAYHDEA